jgi:hypothetical protein
MNQSHRGELVEKSGFSTAVLNRLNTTDFEILQKSG